MTDASLAASSSILMTAVFAVALLASGDAALTAKLQAFRVAQTEVARHMTLLSHV